MEKTKRNSLTFQMYRFYIVGLLNTVSMYSLYSLLVFIGVDYILSLIVDYMLGGFLSYFLNKKYTFNHNDSHTIKMFAKMAAILISTLIINLIILMYLVEYKQYNVYLAQFLSIVIVSLLSFYLQKTQVFIGS